MDFSYSETQQELKTLVAEILADFANVERLKQLEKNGANHGAGNGAYFDKELWQQWAESGVLSAFIPSSLGGMALDFTAVALVAEQIGRTMVAVPYLPCMVSVALPLCSFAISTEVRACLKALMTGESIVVPAIVEPQNEDLFRPQVNITFTQGEWLVEGIKHCVPYAGYADTLLVTGLYQDELWVGLVTTQQPGVNLEAQQCTANELQYQVSLRQARANCVAQGVAAKTLLQHSLALTTVAYCSMAVGMVEAMTKLAAQYTSQRQQFGVPIATFQAVAHRLASCYIDTECLRSLTQKAVCDVNQGDFDSEVIAMAKASCGDILHRVSHAVQHVHGGIGIDRDYPLFRYCLWAKQIELTMGCSKVHLTALADRVAARYLQNG
jgi:alkylation response protein AidB-like acyl-CoA dehydrogenase